MAIEVRIRVVRRRMRQMTPGTMKTELSKFGLYQTLGWGMTIPRPIWPFISVSKFKGLLYEKGKRALEPWMICAKKKKRRRENDTLSEWLHTRHNLVSRCLENYYPR
jgi:hypothetical protein